MARRKLTKTSILREPELSALREGLRQALGPEIVATIRSYGIDMDATLRFSSVAEKCRAAREERGFSLKQVALKLKVPQYRLREIEDARTKAIDGAMLDAYVELLGIKQWFCQWAKQNRALHAKLTKSAG
jgi:ribosome-binding protein aMBF1 (putative translation factor)